MCLKLPAVSSVISWAVFADTGHAALSLCMLSILAEPADLHSNQQSL